MNFTIAEFLSFTVQQQAANVADAKAEKVKEFLDSMSPFEKIMFVLDTAGVSPVTLAVGLILFVGVITLMFIFWRKWNLSRMGYVIVTAMVIGVRAENPTDIFSSVVAFVGGIIALVVSIYSFRHIEYSTMKEPLYFLFNSFAMFMVAFPIGSEAPFYNMVVALVAMCSSLYFIIAVNFSSRSSNKKNVEKSVINVLDKKRDKNYGKPPWEHNKKQNG